MYIYKVIKNMIGNKEFRQKMLYTIFMGLFFRYIAYIPTPFIDGAKLNLMAENDLLNLAGMFSGGALQNFTIMATGISSYITASIVIQLLTYSSPKLYELQKNQSGQDKIKRITIVLGIILGIISSLGLTAMMNNEYEILIKDSFSIYLAIALIHAAGTGLAIWIGESITKKGIGNGVSLLIFINIVSQLPVKYKSLLFIGIANPMDLMVLLLIIILVAVAIVVMELSEVRIPIRNTAELLREGNPLIKMTKENYLPMKMNLTGVMPIIFTTTVIQMFSMLDGVIKYSWYTKFVRFIEPGDISGMVFMTISIFVFSYFYNSLIFNPKDLSDSLQAKGSIIPTLRPGKETAHYLEYMNKKTTFINAMYLAAINLIPTMVLLQLNLPMIAITSVMIIVGVAIEITSNIKAEVNLAESYNYIDLLDVKIEKE